MRISDRMKETQFLSLEFFPPKDKTLWPGWYGVVDKLRALNPLFVSMTYGAGGSTRAHTLELVTRLREEFQLRPMAHLTCVGAEENGLDDFLMDLRRSGVTNVLALRGDPPKGQSVFVPDNQRFSHASDLVGFIRSRYPEMEVGVACYPETHPEAVSPEEDVAQLKRKLDLGAEFAITQLFFDNAVYYAFMERCRAAGIRKPVVPGVLPILSLRSVQNILRLANSSIPSDFLRALEEADRMGGDAAVSRLGIAHARVQVRDLLASGAPGVHLYTLNRAEACLEIAGDLGICSRLGTC